MLLPCSNDSPSPLAPEVGLDAVRVVGRREVHGWNLGPSDLATREGIEPVRGRS